MSPTLLLVFAPLLVLPLLPLLPGPGRRWLPVIAALLPAAAVLVGGTATLPWVMLGAGTVQEPPGVAAVALLAPLFALALWPPRCHLGVGGGAFLLLGQGALSGALLASDLLLLLAGFTLATYALLAARLGVGRTVPGQLPGVIAMLVLGDLAAFELALLLAKAAANALVPRVSAVAGAVVSSSFTAAFALLAAGSRGALLLLAGRGSGVSLPLAALVLLVVPTRGWRLGGSSGAVGAAAAAALVALLTAALTRLLSLWLPRLTAREGSPFPGRRSAEAAGGKRGPVASRLSTRLGALELAIGSWGLALGACVILLLLLLAATQR